MTEKALSEQGAALLSLKVVREKDAPYCGTDEQVTKPEIAAGIFERVFALTEQAEEVLCMITLDTRRRPSGFWRVSTGSLTQSIVHPREVFKRALLANAHSVILAHNHPSGDPEFSPEDRECARKIAEAGKIIGVSLLDFLAIGTGDRYQSASEEGILDSSAF